MNISEIQKRIADFTEQTGLSSCLEIRSLDLVSEVGELSKELLKGTDYGKKAFSRTEEWDEELGDVFFSLLCIANESGSDLGEALEQVLVKYEKRFAATGYLGSGR